MGFFLLMKKKETIEHITQWLSEYSKRSNTKGFIIGISGGIDSALTSTLCARTGKTLICLTMPIHQKSDEVSRAHDHITWLKSNYQDVHHIEVDLTQTFDDMTRAFPDDTANNFLAMANTRARLRMTTLYAIGQANGCLVAGTGNKVEDFGVGFFTKYGDGGVDLSPIADLMKSEVYDLARELGVIDDILNARPTDGLWEDGRTDEDQIGASYDELEWAMTYQGNGQSLSERQIEVLDIYNGYHSRNKHKMVPIPVCIIPEALK